ncbi:MAG: ATP-binding protein [Gammaproteobacteria bacterium]
MLKIEEIEALADMESYRVERKKSAADSSGIRRNICAFANDLPESGKPGIIIIGVHDDGSCAGLDVTDELLTKLSQMRGDGNILPPPTLHVEKQVLGSCDVATIIVSPSESTPVRYQGRVWVKVGPTVQLATADEERLLAERRRAGDLPFDCRPAVEASTADLNLEFFQTQYLPSAVARDVLELNNRSVDQQLASLRFLTRGYPSFGALIIFGMDPLGWAPGAYVQFLRIDGEELTDPIRDQKRLTGPVYQVLSRMDELVELNISTATDVVSARTEIRRPDYPHVALQQLTRNAIMHRNYDGTGAPVKIYWFSDRIEISNPGDLYGQVNRNNFGKGATDYRNPLIAEAMKVLGYVQQFGLGIPLTLQALEKNGNPQPEFDFGNGSFLATIRKAV